MVDNKNNFLATDEPLLNTNNNNNTENFFHDIKDNHKNKLIYSNSLDNLLKNDEKWAEKINEYYSNKKILKWGHNPKPKMIRGKYVKSQDLVFNPITQKYTDNKYDLELKKQEEKNLKDTIAKGYDNELRVMQTFDIINLNDRLKLFKNHPDYPKNNLNHSHMSNYKKINISSGERNYNILSNINLNLHHYDKPENRPPIQPTENNKKKLRIGNLVQYRDYDIISNKYQNFDKEKKALDKEVIIADCSKKFFDKRDYDVIKGIYVDKEKEQKFQQEVKTKMEKLKQRKRDTIFNPFNNEIYDQKKYEELNQKMKNKIERYTLRSKIDKFYNQEELKRDIIKNNSLKTKVNYNKFKEIDRRGYDILNGENNFYHYKNSLSCRNIQKPWEMIKNGVNENQTLKDKKIYLLYDYEDVNKRFKDNEVLRKNKLKNLPKIENEKIFQMNRPVHKINENLLKKNHSEIFNNRYEISENNINRFNIQKSLWFSGDKEINYK